MEADVKYESVFNLNLALDVLKAEGLADVITLFELKKNKNVCSFDELFSALKQYVKIPTEKLQIDVEQIYDIIYSENIEVGSYRVATVHSLSGIRSLIGKWNPPSVGQMKIGEVVDDIYRRATELVQGETYYYTGKHRDPLFKGKYAYKLIVNNNIIIFVDLNKRILYHILMR